MTNAAHPLPRRFCSNHPQRPALGVCVITAAPICGECSTRYEGVNYSKEGLRLMRERQAATDARRPAGARALAVGAWLLTPALLYLVYLAYQQTAQIAVILLRQDH